MRVVVVALLAVLAVAQESNASLQWEPVSLASSSPELPGREQFATGFDAVRNQIVVFGGKTPGGLRDDTWVFNMTSGVWREVTGGAKPARRFSMVAGVDQAGGRDRFLVTLGEGDSKTFYNDVWAFDLGTETWSQVTTSGPLPEERYGSAGGILPDGQGTELIITHGFADTRYQNTFALDLATDTWTDVTPSQGDLPFKRCLHSGVAQGSSNVVLATGCGSGGFGPCPAVDAWMIRGTASNRRWHKSSSPCIGPRMVSAMAHLPGDAASVVVFGGNGWIWGSGDAGVVAVWNTTEDSWARVSPAAPSGSPSVRSGMGLVQGQDSSGNAAIVMVGGLASGSVLGDVWLLRGDSTAGMPKLDCPFWMDLRIPHGITMGLAWGIILPVGITIARFGRDAKWFPWHKRLQYTGVVLNLLGLVLAILMVGAGKFSAVPHSIIGLLVAVIGLQQPLNAACRPHPKPPSLKRKIFEIVHMTAGRIGGLLGVINIFWGLFYIAGREIGALFVLYTIWVIALVGFWIVSTMMGLPGEEYPHGSSRVAAAVNLLGGTSVAQKLRRRVCRVRSKEERDAAKREEEAKEKAKRDAEAGTTRVTEMASVASSRSK